MPKTKRFAANEYYAKLFQVSVGRSSHTVFFSLLRMIAKKERGNLRGANGSPKIAGILSMPASPRAVHLLPVGSWQLPRLAGSGWTPDPLSHWQKKNMSGMITQQF